MKKVAKIAGITLAVALIIFILLILTPFLFREKFAQLVKQTANKAITTELNFSEMDLSFLRHFPHFTVTLKDFSLISSAPFQTDTLIGAREISFGVNLLSLVRGPVEITRLYINQGKILIQYNENGTSSFEIYHTFSDTTEKADTASSGNAAIKIGHIDLIRTDFTYSDPSIPLKMEAHGINYRGKSDLVSGEVLRLTSSVKIDSFDLYFDSTPWLLSKPVKAELTTSINMSTLEVKFEKNNLFIKEIPFEFRGELTFRQNGYSFFIALFSMFGEEYLSGSVWLVSTNTLWLSAKADIKVNLEHWTKGFGLREMDLKGLFSMKLNARGEYATGQDPKSKTPDTVVLRIPDFTLTSKLTNGYFKYNQLPEAITGITFDLEASSTRHDYRTTQLRIENLKAGFLDNQLEGYIRVKGLKNFPVEAHLFTRLNLAELKDVVPMDSLELTGMVDLDLDVNGSYHPAGKQFPVTSLNLNVTDGSIRTTFFPHPVEHINLVAAVMNETGTLPGTHVTVNPLSFSFRGNPFTMSADLVNPDNLNYSIRSKGSVDLAGIYRLFSPAGMELEGFVSTDLQLKGTQADALAGRIDKLQNHGELVLKNIAFRSEYLTQPLILQSGVFRFRNDSIRFTKFEARYGESDITMNGYLNNVVNYLLTENQLLKGNFSFRSNYLLLDEFISENDEGSRIQEPGSGTVAPGVIVIPANLEIGMKVTASKVRFEGLDLDSVTSSVEIKQGLLLMKSLNFTLIGCRVAMDATYGSLSPDRALFDFHIRAKDFDIKRAYNSVELFRNLTASAGKCEGIVSLDYTLRGKLGGGMVPIYPSLEGGGTLSLEQVKVMGLELFTGMAKNLEKEKIKNPDLSNVEIKSTIKNNVITLERTRMKIAGFRFRVEGETNFNGALNLKTRLGLPPLGIVGIPMRVLGTQENPKFRYGRGTRDESVEETEYTDEISPEMLELIRQAKEEDIPDDPSR